MRRVTLAVGVAAALVLPAAALAAKTYVVKGHVTDLSDRNITIERGDEKWVIARPENLKVEGGRLEVGKEVTIRYDMSARSVEVKGRTAMVPENEARPVVVQENQPVTVVEKVADGAVKTTDNVIRSPGMPIEKTGQVAGKVLEAPGKAVGNVSPTTGKILEVPGKAVQKTGEVAGTVVDKTAEGTGNLIRNPVGTIGGAIKKTGEAVENTAGKVMGTNAPNQ